MISDDVTYSRDCLICWYMLTEWRITTKVTQGSRCWTFEASTRFLICFFVGWWWDPKVNMKKWCYFGTYFVDFHRGKTPSVETIQNFELSHSSATWIYGTSKGSFRLEALVLRKQFPVLMGTGASAGKKERRRHRHADEELKLGCVFCMFFWKYVDGTCYYFTSLVRQRQRTKKWNLLKWEHVPCIEKWFLFFSFSPFFFVLVRPTSILAIFVVNFLRPTRNVYRDCERGDERARDLYYEKMETLTLLFAPPNIGDMVLVQWIYMNGQNIYGKGMKGISGQSIPTYVLYW